MTIGTEEDVVKEIHGATIHRVDAVDGAATGIPFLVLKALDPESVTKAAEDLDVLADPDAALAAADDAAAGAPVPTDAPGDPGDPGSPAWEAVDAAAARSAVEGLVALRQLACDLAEREGIEGAASDGAGYESQWDLQIATCAIDEALAILAKFAVDEQASADQGAADAEDQAKAMGLMKALADPESPVLKAGRVLSAANENTLKAAQTAMNDAVTAITSVLGQVAPVEKQETPVTDHNPTPDTEPVTKADDAPDAAETEPVVKAEDALASTSVADLKRTAMTGSGSEQKAALAELGLRVIMGTLDAAPAAEEPADDAEPADAGDAETDSAAADPTNAAPPAVPAAPVDASTPDDSVAKALEPDPGIDVEEIVRKALEDRDGELVAVRKRLDDLERQPAGGGPLLSGAPVPSVQTRGQELTAGGEQEALRKAFEDETDPIRKQQLQMQLAVDMVKHAPLAQGHTPTV